MVDCDMCGKKDTSVQRVKIETTIMSVCNQCARFGTPLADHSKAIKNLSRPSFSRMNPDESKSIVNNYGEIIRNSRESRRLKQSEFAKLISEKESLMHSIESGHTPPSFKLARKLQKILHIRLIEDTANKRGTIDDMKPQEQATPLTMEEKVLAALKKNKK